MNVDALVRTTLSIADDELRAAFLARTIADAAETGAEAISALGLALDAWCTRAEQAEEAPSNALVALVDAVHRLDIADAVQRLREEAASGSLLALERFLRHPPPRPGVLPSRPPTRLPDLGLGHPVTLGERKALARRPDRALLERLVADPHPDVIARVLANPRLTEDDVVRIVARRPGRPEVLAQIARSTRWVHSARVRMALVLHPDTPPEVAVPITGLLVRQELRLVATSPQVPPAVRALCLERLSRRPPQPGEAGGGALQ